MASEPVRSSAPNSVQMLQIGSHSISMPAVQAALSGYSDAPMRVVARAHGCAYAVHEVVLDKLVLHHGLMVEGTLNVEQKVETEVSAPERAATMKNHTATHLLHKALRDAVGLHVRQAGSLVDPDKLRFDFSHFAPLSHETVKEIEDAVNQRILGNPVSGSLSATADADRAGQGQPHQTHPPARFGTGRRQRTRAGHSDFRHRL